MEEIQESYWRERHGWCVSCGGMRVCRCLSQPLSNALSYPCKKKQKKKSRLSSSVQLWLAHNIILCSPVAGGDRRGAGIKITPGVHISFCLMWSLVGLFFLPPQYNGSERNIVGALVTLEKICYLCWITQ